MFDINKEQKLVPEFRCKCGWTRFKILVTSDKLRVVCANMRCKEEVVVLDRKNDIQTKETKKV